MEQKDVYEYIKTEEQEYKTKLVPIADGYEWNMYEHIRKSMLRRDSKYTEGANDGVRPYKNIIRRIRNLSLVAMNFDVKDIQPFVNDSKNYYKSFLVKKYHPKWARKHNLDTYIDDLVESYHDFGGALSKHVNKVRPEIVKLPSLAFCDQTDILSGPICIKHQYSPAQLKKFEGKWGVKGSSDATIDEIITLARNEKTDFSDNRKITTPGKFIEVYELDGMFPRAWLKEESTEEDWNTYTQQLHIVTYYRNEKGEKKGLSLYRGKGDPEKYKFIGRDEIFGRALGFGGIEELFEPQIWTNYNMIRLQEMLDHASKHIYQTADATFATKNNIRDADNGEVFVHKEGMPITPVNNQPINYNLFQQANALWEDHAQGVGSANDALLGESPSSGTPFKLQESLINQGQGLHEFRKGKIATHVGEIYRDWILGDLKKEMMKEQEFMEELDLDELNYLADAIANCEVYKMEAEKVLSGQDIDLEERELMKQGIRQSFVSSGNKKFFKLLQDELKDLPIDVEVNIGGKQKNLALLTDKLVNIFRQVFATPQILDDPRAAKIFNMILESSGLSQVNFQSNQYKPTNQPPPMTATEPLQELANATT